MAENEIEQLSDIYSQIREALVSSRRQAYSAVNFAMVQAYWNIGRIIVEHEQNGELRAEYGKAVLQNVSERLTAEFGKGFSPRSLRAMRMFYLRFPIWQAVLAKLSWTHFTLLIKVESDKAREWYLNEAVASAWTTRQLERQIATQYYDRLLASQKPELVKAEAADLLSEYLPENFIKDPYVLDFLDLKNYPALRESDVEKALIDKLQDFLLELSFVRRFLPRNIASHSQLKKSCSEN